MPSADLIVQIVNPLISAVSGLGGVVLGGILTSRHFRQERRQRFIRDKLVEFYAPMLGIRERLRAKAETRLKVSTAAGEVWPTLIEHAQAGGVEQVRKVEEELSPQFDKIIEHNNRQLREELIPLYHQMIDVFTTKMHLAEPSTRQHFTTLVEFVEVWDRFLGDTLPHDVARRVAVSEESLKPFYADLATNFERLQAMHTE